MDFVGITVRPDKESSPDPSKPIWLYDAGYHKDFVDAVLDGLNKDGTYDVVVDGKKVRGTVEKISYMSDKVSRTLEITPQEYYEYGKSREVTKPDNFKLLGE